jgi:hypothetical protein
MFCGYQVDEKEAICPHCLQKFYPVEIDRPNICGECDFFDRMNDYCKPKGQGHCNNIACNFFNLRGAIEERL